MKNNKNQNVYSVGVLKNEDGTIKVYDALKLVKKNQYSSRWQKANSREVARELNRGKLVIK
ncbi:MAG: hypothetical protein Q8O88_04520 [bacterium]|nr:hypothetical protein [bacterium]